MEIESSNAPNIQINVDQMARRKHCGKAEKTGDFSLLTHLKWHDARNLGMSKGLGVICQTQLSFQKITFKSKKRRAGN